MTRTLFAGVDLGGTSIRAALGDAEGNVVAECTVPTASQRGAEPVVEDLIGAVSQLRDSSAGTRLGAIGVGCPGLVDRAAGVVRWLPNFSGHWENLKLAERLTSELGAPTHLLNDVRCAAVGELCFGYGAGRRAPTFVVVTLGTGVGGAVVIDGRLRLGASDAAGEIGHLEVQAHGARCGCGRRGCLETVASAPALVGEATRLLLSGQTPGLRAQLERTGQTVVTPEAIAAAAASGDPAMLDCIDRYAEVLARGAAAAVVLLLPEAIVFGGGVSGMGELLRARIEHHLLAAVNIVPVDQVEVVLSPLAGRAGVLGGIALAAASGDLEALGASNVAPDAS
jgi:glucokinase